MGAVNGRVTDSSDAVLPGVSVSVSGPAEMAIRSTVTDENGMFRLPGLAPGEYRVVYALAGFSTIVREQVQVLVGFTATVNAKLGAATLEEAVTVQGGSPVVDATAIAFRPNDAAQLASGIASPADNRLYRFYDRNADIGGPLKKDRLWWYTLRDEKSQARCANFPGPPFETRLTNYTGKLTYQLSSKEELIAYGQAGKKLQEDRQLLVRDSTRRPGQPARDRRQRRVALRRWSDSRASNS